MPPLACEILDFWFGPLPHAARAEWFHKDPAFDASIVTGFGRYPHRNALLGRISTPEELAFLQEPGSRF